MYTYVMWLHNMMVIRYMNTFWLHFVVCNIDEILNEIYGRHEMNFTEHKKQFSSFFFRIIVVLACRYALNFRFY